MFSATGGDLRRSGSACSTVDEHSFLTQYTSFFTIGVVIVLTVDG